MNPTVQTLIASAIQMMNNIESKRIDAEALLAYSIGISRIELLTDLHRSISNHYVNKFLQFIEQRISGKPISKIIGSKEFWSQNFVVNEHVLDPRPDSETVIETLLKLCINKNQNYKIADFGTGTGCLAIIAALELPKAKICAFERNTQAFQMAYKNIKNHNLLNRIKLRMLSWTKCSQTFDIILSNPPYIGMTEFNSLSKEVKFFDPETSLYGGFNGLMPYFEIFPILQRQLNKSGIAILEIGEKQSCLLHYARRHGFMKSYLVKDLNKKERVLVLRRTNARNLCL